MVTIWYSFGKLLTQDGTDGFVPPAEEYHKYSDFLYFDVNDGYIYYINPDPDEYGKIYRMPTNGKRTDRVCD